MWGSNPPFSFQMIIQKMRIVLTQMKRNLLANLVVRKKLAALKMTWCWVLQICHSVIPVKKGFRRVLSNTPPLCQTTILKYYLDNVLMRIRALLFRQCRPGLSAQLGQAPPDRTLQISDLLRHLPGINKLKQLQSTMTLFLCLLPIQHRHIQVEVPLTAKIGRNRHKLTITH